MAKLVVDKESLVSVADAIREKGGTSESLTFPQGFVDGIGAISSGGGGTEEIEQIIDESGVLDSTEGTVEDKVGRLIDKAEDENLWYEHFANVGFSYSSTWGFFKDFTGTTLPRIDVSKFKTMQYFCGSASNLERIDFYLNSKESSSSFNAFRNTTSLKYIKGINTSSVTNANSMFDNSAIEEIEEPLDFGKVTSAARFQVGGYLREIRFFSETIKVSIQLSSPVLSAESIQSIIDGLAYVESTQNLTLSNKIVLTDNQKQVINAKGWTLIQ